MKKIMVITSTRADYGLLRPVIKRINDSDKLQLCLVATGTQLLKEYGCTVKEIEADAFPISHRIQIMSALEKSENLDKAVDKQALKEAIWNINQLPKEEISRIKELSKEEILGKNQPADEEIIHKNLLQTDSLEGIQFSSKEAVTAGIISETIIKFTALFQAEKPDLALVLGDRYEIFAVATAAATLSVPLAHISGGDVTQGAKDDFYRHCITKMANLHFPSCEESRKRVVQLGENPSTVFNVGGLGDENIRNIPLLSLQELENSLDFAPLQPFALITYHPETQKNSLPCEEMQKLLNALKTTNLNLIFTKANADAGGSEINALVDDFCKENSTRAKAFFSLGLKRYLSAMKYCAVVVGNSSSGVVETPSFGVSCVNIGERQKGRYIAENVICTTGEEMDITKGLEKALFQEFIIKAKRAKSPYFNDCVPSEEIVRHITDFVYAPKNIIKTFYDL